MKLVSVQVGRPRMVWWRGKAVSTGIYKEPVAGRIMLHRFNLDGDQQVSVIQRYRQYFQGDDD